VSTSGAGRTRAFQFLTLLPHDWLVAGDRAARGGGPAATALGPARRWLESGTLRVPQGAGQDLRLSLAHLPVINRHAGLLARGVAELPVQEALRRLVAPGHVVYDLGASIGFFSLLAARLTGPAGRVVALEPSPAPAEAIRVNAALNELHNVTVVEVAAGAAAGREQLWVVPDQTSSHLASRGEHADAQEAVEVEVVALDELIAERDLPPPSLVKLDVEGSELDALAGMRDTLECHRPKLVCELHGTNEAFDALMEEIGYSASSLDGPQPVREAGENAHVLALPD
jgi:FkbM family methyltransferase